MPRANGARRSPGARAEIEHALHLEALRRRGEALVQLVVGGHLRRDELGVGRRVEMELAQAR
jgi:hypothetical protein